MLNDFINELALDISSKYKIESENVKQYILNELKKEPQLKDQIDQHENNIKKLKKSRTFKKFIKSVKKNIYYELRTYQKGKTPVLENSHISTKERAPYANSLYKQINPYLKSSENVIDVGGGIFPVTFNFEKYKNIKKYIWVDKDKKSYEKLKLFKKDHALDRLILLCEKIGKQKWEDYLAQCNIKDSFDFALYLKLIPVVYRQDRSVLNFLSNIPAKTVLVTGSKEAMVKRQNIERREGKVIKAFIDQSGKSIVEKIEIENEFGYIIK